MPKIPTTADIELEFRRRKDAEEERYMAATLENMEEHQEQSIAILCKRIRRAIIEAGHGEEAGFLFARVRDSLKEPLK